MRFLLSIIVASFLLTSPSQAQLFRRLVNPQQQQLQFLRQQQLRRKFEAQRQAAEKAAAKARKEAKRKAQVAESKKKISDSKKSVKRTKVAEREKSERKTSRSKTSTESTETSIADIPKEMMGPKTLNHKGFGMTLKLIKGKVVVAATPKAGMASQAGVMKGDILASVGSMPIQFPQDITGFDKILSPGDMVDFELLRKGKKETVTVPYKKKPVEEGTLIEGAVAQNDELKANVNDVEEKLEPIASTTPVPEALPLNEPTPAIRMDEPSLTTDESDSKPLDLESLLNGATPEKSVTPPKPPGRNAGLFELPDTGNELPDASRLINNEISELQSLIEEHKLLLRSAQSRLDALKKNVKTK
ncbi:MAG: hypothetical protein AAF497_05700 [Planctomycetota bacterium]